MLKRSRRIANPSFSVWNILGDYGAHPDDCAFADPQGTIFCPLFDDSAGANICMVFDDDISVARDPWREGDEVAYEAVMRNIGLNVAVEESAN